MRSFGVTVGRNRTGIGTSTGAAAELLSATKRTTPSRQGDERGMAEVRVEYARTGDTPGSMPPPTTMKGMAKTALKMLEGKRATILLDKLGERLAFERSGTRLYEALISKHDAYGSWPNGPSRDDLVHIHGEELQHFLMLKEAIQTLGADPTAVTPSANVHAVASDGLPAVLSDPRTDLQQCLEAILVAELVDNDCWENLVDLATTLGIDDLAANATSALEEEREHLERVRRWLSAALSQQVAGRLTEPFAERARTRATALRARASTGDGNGAASAPEPPATSRRSRSRRARTAAGSRGHRPSRKRTRSNRGSGRRSKKRRRAR